MPAEWEQMPAERDYWAVKLARLGKRNILALRPNINNMVNMILFSGGAKQLDRFLDVLRLNFNSHGHQFPCGGPDHDKYAISSQDAWSNHQNPAHR
jgi:hypothetical protein